MFSFPKLFPIAALVLLFSAAFCFSADLIHDLSLDQSTAQTDSCSDDGGSLPDCFCCCSHFVPSGRAPAITMTRITFVASPERESLPFTPPGPFFRPPRA